MTRRASRWSARRADDFPPGGAGGNRAFCCSCTCCIPLITAAIGGLVGIGLGIKFAIAPAGRIASTEKDGSARTIFAGVGGFILSWIPATVCAVSASASIVPYILFGLPAIFVAASLAHPGSRRFLGATGVVSLYVAIGLLLGSVVGFAIGIPLMSVLK